MDLYVYIRVAYASRDKYYRDKATVVLAHQQSRQAEEGFHVYCVSALDPFFLIVRK